MKKYVYIFLTTMMFMTSCSDNRVEKFVERFTAAINNNDRGTIERLYPDAKKASVIALNFNRDSLNIESGGQQDEYIVTFAPNVWMRVAVGNNDSLVVKESKGLFSYDQSKLKFAKETGWYNEKLNDAENAERLSDDGFTDYLLKVFNTSIKNGLKIVNIGTWGDDYVAGEWMSCEGMIFTVKNSSPYNVPGSAYNILYKEGYWGGGEMQSEVVQGTDIAAGQQVKLRSKIGSSQESETSHTLRVNDLSMDDFVSQFHPTGKEYEEYLKSGKVSPKEMPQISFGMTGLMGGCGTRLTFDGKDGWLMYNPEGKELITNMTSREVSFVSYDKETQRLVLRVSKTGILDGVYANGTYVGVFKNLNGKTSQFSLK